MSGGFDLPSPGEEQLSQRLGLACTIIGFKEDEHVSMERFYKRLADLVNLEKQVPFFKVVRHMVNLQGRQAAIVTVNFGGVIPPAHLLLFFSQGDNIRTIKVFWESLEDVQRAFEQGMGLRKGEGCDSSEGWEGAPDGGSSPTADGDSGTRQEGEG